MDAEESRRSQAELIDDRTVKVITDNNGEATVVFEVSMRPGNNYRVVATTDWNSLQNCVAFHRVRTAGVYPNRYTFKPIPDTETGEALIKATPALTVWRKLYVEVDSFGVPPDNQQFARDDRLQENFPDVPDPLPNPIPDDHPVKRAFRICYIDVERHPDPNAHQSNLPWRYAFQSNEPPDPNRPDEPNPNLEHHLFEPFWNTRAQHRPDFWCVYVAGVYEVGLTWVIGELSRERVERILDIASEQGDDRDGPRDGGINYGGINEDADNDPNEERTIQGRSLSALLGWTNARIGPATRRSDGTIEFIERARWGRINAPIAIGMETIRDVCAEHGIVNMEGVLGLVVAHEMGHQFALWHSTAYSADQSDLMWSPSINAQEPDVINMRPIFMHRFVFQIRVLNPNSADPWR